MPQESYVQGSSDGDSPTSHPYMTTGKTIALTIQTFVGKVMSLLFNTLSRFVIAFLMRRQSAKELMLSNCGAGGDS